MNKMHNMNNFTFCYQEDDYELEDEWNLDDNDSMEGSSANSLMEIENIAKNMNDVEVSKKISRWHRYHFFENNNEESYKSYNWIKFKDLNQDKTFAKSTSKNIAFERKLLKDEISELLKACVNFNRNLNNQDANYELISNRIYNENVQKCSDNFITMKQIPELN